MIPPFRLKTFGIIVDVIANGTLRYRKQCKGTIAVLPVISSHSTQQKTFSQGTFLGSFNDALSNTHQPPTRTVGYPCRSVESLDEAR
jgi:hypothetical protein